MTFVDDQYDLDFLVNIEQPLNEEGVGDFVLFALVVLEARAVVESHLVDDDLRGDGGLGVLFMADLDARLLGGVEDGLEAVEADHELGASEEGHDGALADSGISDHDDGFCVLLVNGDGLNAGVDESLELMQINGVALLVHIWCRFNI